MWVWYERDVVSREYNQGKGGTGSHGKDSSYLGLAYTKDSDRIEGILTELKGFLGLCTYYRRYVKWFSQFAAPLTDLTKKGAFRWTEVAHQTFEKMKTIMSSCAVWHYQISLGRS